MTDRPNILLILTDQWHPGCTGYAGHPMVKTPNLDRLAARGMVFSRMYTPCPLCMPARASLFTGQTPRTHGVRANGIPLAGNFPTFVDSLRRNGYRTHNAGKVHLHVVNLPRDRDPEEVDPREFPESRELWNRGRVDSLPLPYYGFQSVDYGNAHGHKIYGQYREWLKATDREAFDQLVEPGMLEPPTGAFQLFNRTSFKWALPAEYHPTTWTVSKSIDFLRSTTSETGKSTDFPFFLVCNINDPHPPFCPPAPYCNLFDPARIPDPPSRPHELSDLPPHFEQMRHGNITTSGNNGQPMAATDPYYRECAAHYYGQIQLIDDQIGRLLQELRKRNLEENTLVVFTADHGECLGDHGFWGKGPYHFDGVIRVPFIASWPGRIPEGSTCANPASLLDLAPTFLEVSGTGFEEARPVDPPVAPAAPAPFPGISLAAYWENPGAHEGRNVLVEMDEDFLNLKLRTLVTRRYRLTAYPGHPFGELFDLETDPHELHNLWEEPSMKAIKNELLLQLLDLVTATDGTLPRQVSRS